ncbi:MAG: hypothetical protein LH679_12725 [Cyanobacteria bacterium CAN_BIN43]|nr:hypothetical protein [Cyanobacteria bacterium CAN_BIN43]
MSDHIILKGHSKLLRPAITGIMAMHQLLESYDIGTMYAYHNDLESVKRAGKPKVNLYFMEDSTFNKLAPPNNRQEGRRRLDGLISFRLMDEKTSTFSKANATTIATRIKEIFGANGGFVWNKGKTLYSYTDWDLGYQLQILARTETEAKRVVTAVLAIQSHTPIWKYFNIVKNDEEATTYPENPGTQIVMGEVTDNPRQRPLVDVRFRYAYIKLDGRTKPVNLYSLKHNRMDELVS